MFASGAVLGLLLGGFIIQNYGWQATFLSAIPIAIALFVINSKYNYEKKQCSETVQGEISDRTLSGKPKVVGHKKEEKVDVKGEITLAAFVTSFLLALTLSETTGNNGSGSSSSSGSSVSLFYILVALGITAFVLFVIIERREKTPLWTSRLFYTRLYFPVI